MKEFSLNLNPLINAYHTTVNQISELSILNWTLIVLGFLYLLGWLAIRSSIRNDKSMYDSKNKTIVVPESDVVFTPVIFTIFFIISPIWIPFYLIYNILAVGLIKDVVVGKTPSENVSLTDKPSQRESRRYEYRSENGISWSEFLNDELTQKSDYVLDHLNECLVKNNFGEKNNEDYKNLSNQESKKYEYKFKEDTTKSTWSDEPNLGWHMNALMVLQHEDNKIKVLKSTNPIFENTYEEPDVDKKITKMKEMKDFIEKEDSNLENCKSIIEQQNYFENEMNYIRKNLEENLNSYKYYH